MKKILWHSNAPFVPTGYGSQSALFIPRIRDLGYDVAISAFWGLGGCAQEWEGFKMYPADDSWGNRWAPAYAAHHGDGDPHSVLVITLMDVWVLTGPMWKDLNVASWCPVDHVPAPPRVVEFFTRTGAVPIAMSRFGERELERAGLDPLYVPHGIDTGLLEYKPPARELMELPKDAFIVGMVAANKGATPPRKAFPQVFQAFAELRRRHSDALLYLHTFKQSPEGLDLLALAGVTGVPLEAIRWTPEFEQIIGVDYAKMSYVYSVMDLLANPAYGEGFGIPIVEAQACGTPVLVNDFSAMSELCGSGWAVQGERWYDATQGANFQSPSVSELTDRMLDAYDLKGTGRAAEMRQEARAFAEGYDVDRVTREYWVPALEQIEQRIAAKSSARARQNGPMPPVRLHKTKARTR